MWGRPKNCDRRWKRGGGEIAENSGYQRRSRCQWLRAKRACVHDRPASPIDRLRCGVNRDDGQSRPSHPKDYAHELFNRSHIAENRGARNTQR
jgi:hypothetical protein